MFRGPSLPKKEFVNPKTSLTLLFQLRSPVAAGGLVPRSAIGYNGIVTNMREVKHSVHITPAVICHPIVVLDSK